MAEESFREFDLAKLFVGNITYNTGERELRDLYSKYGTVKEVRVAVDANSGRTRGFAFVIMNSAEEAKAGMEATNGIDLDGRPIRVEVSTGERRPRREGGGGGRGGGGEDRRTGGGADRGGRDDRDYARRDYTRGGDRGYDRGDRGHDRGHDRSDRGHDRGDRGYDRGGRDYDRGDRGYDRGGRDYDRTRDKSRDRHATRDRSRDRR